MKSPLDKNTDISPGQYENLERYILKQMPPEEYEAFTLQLQNDPALQHKLEIVNLLVLGIREVSLEEKMEGFHRGMSLSKDNRPGSQGKLLLMKRWAIAASVIILVGLGALLFLNKDTDQERIFTAYYKPDPGLITAMGTTDNYLFEHAMIDYKTKNYQSALKTWQDLLKTDPSNDTLNYFIGAAFLADERPEEALPYFKKVIGQTDSYFLKEACWYLGLILVKQDKIDEAIAYIQRSDHQNKETVLQKLKK